MTSNRDLIQILLADGVVIPCNDPLEGSVLAYRAKFHSEAANQQTRASVEQTPSIPRQSPNQIPVRRINTNQQSPSAAAAPPAIDNTAALCAE